MRRKKCVAMLLAGGQGARLYALTNMVAKPAVSFGAKYRIIDFTLSNCYNSGIDTVGVLTQYQPLILNDYLGNGEPWDLDRSYGGLHSLPPYQAKAGSEWYRGTANAIYQNLHFLHSYNPEHVLILSGDHIYKMDYSKMLEEHIATGADCTIATIDVNVEEATRFGILDYGLDGKITSFEEKPKNPKSNHASMGIYIFKMSSLSEELKRDEEDEKSQNDFGKNIIPHMLATNRKMQAYSFDGYWRDVGTIKSLWETNMDLLGKNPEFSLNSTSEDKIYGRTGGSPPTYLGTDAKVQNSIMTSCEIYGSVVNSVLSEGVFVGKGAVVRDSIIMKGTTIEEGAKVEFSIIDENVTIAPNSKIGVGGDKDSLVLIGRDVKLPKGCSIKSGDIIERYINENK
ncbi:MAG: glucose-1-phosphate adenylyltransferase [Firmicutes bacterium]|nr:glucose-1-phosphate adenylyltransferase [Bacillota bacterium]